MKKFKATWEKVVECHGQTIEGAVVWFMKYLHIYICWCLTLFVVLTYLVFEAISWMVQPYVKSTQKEAKEEAKQANP